MAYLDDPSRRQTFKKVKPGDQPSAAEWNKLCEEVSRLTAGDPRHPKKPTRAIKLMRLSAVMGQFGEGFPDISGDGDSSAAHRRSGVVWYYDETIDDFAPTSNNETKTNITDALRLIYDNQEFVWCVYLEQSGHWHPINPRTIRHAKTVRQPTSGGGPGVYPDSCNDRIYPIKFVKMEYDKDINAAAPTDGTYLDAGDTAPDDYVLNLFTGEGSEFSTPYIPEGTVIWCYNVLQQWYTWICCFDCMDSSSSESSSSIISDSSESSESSSSLSQVSSSSSSLSSQGSSESSSSSFEFSSGGSSESSSSQLDSSVSVSESNERTCITLVRSLSFDAETCILSYQTVCLCWPLGLGITYRTGDCT